ncbi:hypothetical protein B0H13DRAFT_2655941 [Mycena leptocephala]|nr:hypothetical protein B0H13DRAFT_2655941 [Mycena leptocephala]
MSTLRRVLPPSTLHDAGVDFDEGRECSFALHFTLLVIGYQSRVSSFLPHHPAAFSLVLPHSTPIVYHIPNNTPFTRTYIIFLTSFPPLSPPFSIHSLLNQPILLALNNPFSYPSLPPRSHPALSSILSTNRSPSLHALWGASSPADVVILSVGRPSPEKDLSLVVCGVARLGRATRAHTRLVFISHDPHLSTLQRLCAQLGVDAIFLGQLTGRRLGGGAECGCYEMAISIRDDFAEGTTE